VPVSVQGRDFELLVDTGAAYTALSKDVTALLGMPSDPQRTVNIVSIHGGILRVPTVTLTELRVGGLRLVNVTAVVLDLSPVLKFDGMLGMNVLRQFRVTIETDTGTLVLHTIGRHTPSIS
jgi:clan AA aspartic protease (TIGR02281 family)